MTAQQNRVVAFTALALIVVIGFLHYPFDGYSNTVTVTEWEGEGECIQRSAEQIKAETYAEFQADTKCRRSHDHEETANITEWRSEAPLLPWFGPLTHALSAMALVLVLWGGWAYAKSRRA